VGFADDAGTADEGVGFEEDAAGAVVDFSEVMGVGADVEGPGAAALGDFSAMATMGSVGGWVVGGRFGPAAVAGVEGMTEMVGDAEEDACVGDRVCV
jgi:hypothetical protein